MPPLESAAGPAVQSVAPARLVNDLSIQVATVNGSGSQTANLVLLRALFRMGVPVSGKNLFPSNIAGLPTWFTIRANHRGYVARKARIDVLVAMNPETAREDAAGLVPGAVLVFDEPLRLDQQRPDLVSYPVPFDTLVAPICPDAKLRRLVRNMVYDGVLASLLGVEMAELEGALEHQLARKAKSLELNRQALAAGFAYAEANLPKRDPFVVARMDANRGRILVDGNAATAIGAMMAGVTVVTWYPITPSSSVCESLTTYLRRYRMDPDSGQATFAVIQAEDELSALGMALGAGWAGARAMTATSGPGISLMAEFAGLGYWAELPAVIVDVQRAGPSTGLPTRTAQGDLLSAAFLSHGDTAHIVLLPASPGEAYAMMVQAFDLAERYQTPVFVLSDLDLGMNTWMSDPFPFPEHPMDRGKVLDQATLARLGEWGRYRDVDGDGIPYRSLPGTDLPVYLCRGSGHDEQARYSERPDDYRKMLDRLRRKIDGARDAVPSPVAEEIPASRVGVIGYGTSHWAIVESRDTLRERHGLETSYLRLRAFPFGSALASFVERLDRVYVVDQNRDGQMASLVRLGLPPGQADKIRSVRHYDGLPIGETAITDQIAAGEGLTVAAEA